MQHKPRTIGVLALQGAFAEHLRVVRQCGWEAVEVRKPEQLAAIEGLIIPGGESTTIGILLDKFGLIEPLERRVAAGMPIFGTCAGLILLAREIVGSRQVRLGWMDITVRRNWYGRQVDSFEADLEIPCLGGEPFRGVFIRAPLIEAVGPAVSVLAEHEGHPVLARQGRLLVSSFHPELTADSRIHEYFVGMIED